MVKVYFTYGSHEVFPHKNGYMVVVAEDFNDAIAAYRAKYPDCSPNCINCSAFYDEKEWEGAGKYYEGQEPKEILFSDKAKVRKMTVVLQNALEVLVGESGYWTVENKLKYIHKNLGVNEAELAALGIDVKEVFGEC